MCQVRRFPAPAVSAGPSRQEQTAEATPAPACGFPRCCFASERGRSVRMCLQQFSSFMIRTSRIANGLRLVLAWAGRAGNEFSSSR